MKIISRGDQQIIVQREEFIVNFSGDKMIAPVIISVLLCLILLPSTNEGNLGNPRHLLHLDPVDTTNPLFVGIVILVSTVVVGDLLWELWALMKSPARTRLWDRYTLAPDQDTVEVLRYKWGKPLNLCILSQIKNVELIVDIEFRAETTSYSTNVGYSRPVDMFPTSLYKVIVTLETDRQEILEQNSIPLASSDKVQQLFRQTLTETMQAVEELREFLGLPSPIDE
jgi:hypothetical protein